MESVDREFGNLKKNGAALSFTYEYPRPSVAVDCTVFAMDDWKFKILLIERLADPFAGCWALPGGFVEMNETTDNAARRELQEETGLDQVVLEQLFTFSAVDRDPRDRVISVSYFALVKFSDQLVRAGSDAKHAAWFPVCELPKLAFDHEQIVSMALKRIRRKSRYQPIGFELLDRKFTLAQLHKLHETILDEQLDQQTFCNRIPAMDILDELDKTQANEKHRATKLYKQNSKRYKRLTQAG